MKNLITTLFLISTVAFPVFGHWTYDRLIVNGEVIGAPYQYIRQSNNSNTPLQNVNSTDMRCNSGASSGSALGTQTYTVAAGSEVGFGIASSFGHPGPQQVYLSKVPEGVEIADYEGDGDWAKIYTLTYSFNASYGASDGILKWATHKTTKFWFKLAESTAPGDYLLRAEGLALHAAHKANNAQFYVGCAQIKVTGEGKDLPGPTIRFPGGYQWNSTGVLIPEFWSKITNYTAAGPELWPKGTAEEHVLLGERNP
ncbi:lytic polysaccharide monooxygenase [Pleomassaria siparia CBS 279.74]|uniref:lytic cellulose monooxygenase (C4-dehydrogenating) n=1 Tax=Pleomassaria siparia CBS 279.74 TaxID=1314801 RepID=A0A6G1JRX4_9PLEO|nr:lytic polysaccharide monooxygenase [Pleomassaria siparia CBS 279.74]